MSLPKINDFELLEIIGTGSYSTVHRAKNKESKEFFAIKCVAKSSLSPSSTDNLLREIKLLKTLKHKHIVEMTDFRWDERNIYIVMELCNAGNLSTYIKKHKTLPEGTCKFFMHQLAAALKYMRSNNVSHFDLKPQNLLLTKSPTLTLKVADFGFAQILSPSEENHVIKGSPLYMAPEILLKHCYNPSADLWSIGVILYECLFGRAPYSSKTLDELLQKVKAVQKIEVPKTAKISVECQDLLTRLLVHASERRITFDEFFSHSFLNLKQKDSTDKNLMKAIEIVTKAVEEDEKQNYEEAYHLYCEGLQYFVPIITSESDLTRRLQLQDRAMNYLERAEEIKTSCQRVHDLQRQSSQNGECSTSQPVQRKSSENDEPSASQPTQTNRAKVQTALKPSATLSQLYTYFASTPAVIHALDIGRQAELYTYEQNFSVALESFTSALKVLVPLLKNDPPGPRKDLLHKQIINWMKEAESIKALIMAHKLKDPKSDMQTHCCIQ